MKRALTFDKIAMFVILFCVMSAQAHHSYALFDLTQRRTAEGIVAKD